MTRALTNTAVYHNIVLRLKPGPPFIQRLEFFRTLKRSIRCHRLAPGDTRRPRNVTTTESTLLGIVRHVQEFAAVFTRRPDIDKGLLHLDMIHDFLPEGTDGEIWTAGRIRRWRIVGTFLRQSTPFIDPLLPSTIHNAAILMPIHLE